MGARRTRRLEIVHSCSCRLPSAEEEVIEEAAVETQLLKKESAVC
jgi:hypothetical protein